MGVEELQAARARVAAVKLEAGIPNNPELPDLTAVAKKYAAGYGADIPVATLNSLAPLLAQASHGDFTDAEAKKLAEASKPEGSVGGVGRFFNVIGSSLSYPWTMARETFGGAPKSLPARLAIGLGGLSPTVMGSAAGKAIMSEGTEQPPSVDKGFSGGLNRLARSLQGEAPGPESGITTPSSFIKEKNLWRPVVGVQTLGLSEAVKATTGQKLYENPFFQTAAGLGADIAGDPLTWVGMGVPGKVATGLKYLDETGGTLAPEAAALYSKQAPQVAAKFEEAASKAATAEQAATELDKTAGIVKDVVQNPTTTFRVNPYVTPQEALPKQAAGMVDALQKTATQTETVATNALKEAQGFLPKAEGLAKERIGVQEWAKTQGYSLKQVAEDPAIRAEAEKVLDPRHNPFSNMDPGGLDTLFGEMGPEGLKPPAPVTIEDKANLKGAQKVLKSVLKDASSTPKDIATARQAAREAEAAVRPNKALLSSKVINKIDKGIGQGGIRFMGQPIIKGDDLARFGSEVSKLADKVPGMRQGLQAIAAIHDKFSLMNSVAKRSVRQGLPGFEDLSQNLTQRSLSHLGDIFSYAQGHSESFMASQVKLIKDTGFLDMPVPAQEAIRDVIETRSPEAYAKAAELGIDSTKADQLATPIEQALSNVLDKVQAMDSSFKGRANFFPQRRDPRTLFQTVDQIAGGGVRSEARIGQERILNAPTMAKKGYKGPAEALGIYFDQAGKDIRDMTLIQRLAAETSAARGVPFLMGNKFVDASGNIVEAKQLKNVLKDTGAFATVGGEIPKKLGQMYLDPIAEQMVRNMLAPQKELGAISNAVATLIAPFLRAWKQFVIMPFGGYHLRNLRTNIWMMTASGAYKNPWTMVQDYEWAAKHGLEIFTARKAEAAARGIAEGGGGGAAGDIVRVGGPVVGGGSGLLQNMRRNASENRFRGEGRNAVAGVTPDTVPNGWSVTPEQGIHVPSTGGIGNLIYGPKLPSYTGPFGSEFGGQFSQGGDAIWQAAVHTGTVNEDITTPGSRIPLATMMEGQVTERGDQAFRNRRVHIPRKLNPMEYFRAGGSANENMARAALFRRTILNKVGSEAAFRNILDTQPRLAMAMMDDAANVVKTWLFNYDELTQTERTLRRTIAPFMTWFRKNTELQLRLFSQHPGTYSRVVQYPQTLTAAAGGRGDTFVPDYIKQDYVGGKLLGNLNIDFDAPTKGLTEIIRPAAAIAGMDPQGIKQGVGSFIGGNVITGPVGGLGGLLTGIDPFTQRPISDEPVAAPGILGPLTGKLAVKTGTDASGQTQRTMMPAVSGKTDYAIRNIAPFGRLYQLSKTLPVVGAQDPALQSKLPMKLASDVGGLGVAMTTPQTQAAELQNREQTIRDIFKQAEYAGRKPPSMADLQKQGLEPGTGVSSLSPQDQIARTIKKLKSGKAPKKTRGSIRLKKAVPKKAKMPRSKTTSPKKRVTRSVRVKTH